MSLIGLASALLVAASTPATAGAFAAGESDPRWSVEQGIQSAKTELAHCAASAKTEPCVRAVYRVCEREHGLSTHAMTDCTVYVERAAEAELSDAERRARLWIKKHPGTAKAELARQTVRAQAAWKLRAVRADGARARARGGTAMPRGPIRAVRA